MKARDALGLDRADDAPLISNRTSEVPCQLRVNVSPGAGPLSEQIMRVITAPQEVTLLNRNAIEAEVLRHVPMGEAVAIDFSNTVYIDNRGFGMLLTLRKRIQEAGGELLLLELAPSIRELMEKICILQLFAIGQANDESSTTPLATS